MAAPTEKRLSVPILQLPQHATASSIADMLLGSGISGDYSSERGTPAYLTPLAFATVTVPLAVIERVACGMYSTASLLREHSLCNLAGLGMMPANRAKLIQRVVTGKYEQYLSPHLASWTACDYRPVQTCEQCEWESWRTLGVRAILCPHQIPFVKACFACGNLLTKRTGSARPPKPRYREAEGVAVQFARVAYRIAREANTPSALKARLLGVLRDHGYVHAYGAFRTSALRQEFNSFCSGAVVDRQLAHLAQYPWRLNCLLRWIGDSDDCVSIIHPVYIILLDQFLTEGGRYHANVRPYVRPDTPGKWPFDWVAKTAGKMYRLPVDRRKRYGRKDFPTLVAAGFTREEIKDIIGLKCVETVDQYLREDGLRLLYDNIRLVLRRREARERWTAMERLFPALRPSVLRRKCPNLFAWLERNDREWLKQRFALSTGVPGGGSADHLIARVSKEKNSALEARIRQAICRIYESRPMRRCSFSEMFRETGLTRTSLGAARKNARIDRLILRAHETSADFQARRKSARKYDLSARR